MFRKLFIIFLSITGILLLWLLFRTISFQEIIVFTRSLKLWQIFVIAAFPVATYFLAAFRWHIILSGLGAKIKFSKLWQWSFVGAGVSLFAPSFDLSGQTAKAFLFKEELPRPGVAFASVYIDSLLRLVTNVSLAFLVLLLLVFDGVESGEGNLVLVSLGLFLLVIYLFWWWLRRGGLLSLILISFFQPKGSVREEIQEVDRAFKAFLEDSPRVFSVLGISALSFLWEILQLAAILYFLTPLETKSLTGLFFPAVGLFIGMIIPGSLPVPGGIGFKEAGAVIAGVLVGLGGTLGITAAILLRIRDLMVVLLGGFFFLRERIGRAFLFR